MENDGTTTLTGCRRLKMRRKINISLLFASISFVLTLVFANVSWEFSDYKYSSSFLSVTAAVKEPVGQIIVAQGDDEPICEGAGGPYNCDARNPEEIEMITPKDGSTVNKLTSTISWKAVPEVKSYFVIIKDIADTNKVIFDKKFTEAEFSKSAEGEIKINYSFGDLTLGRNYRLIIQAVTESASKPEGAIKFKVGKENS